MVYLIYLCLVAPLSLMLFLLPKESRRVITFVIIGTTMCLCAGEFNTLVIALFGVGISEAAVTYTPIIEELLKMLPVLFFATCISDDKQKLLTVAMAVGVGFATLENTYVMITNTSQIDLLFAFAHGFASALMHGICTAAVGYGLSFVKKKKKLFYTGTFGLLAVACIYHAIYNLLVQSAYMYLGLIFPLLTYIPIVFFMIKAKKDAAEAIEATK